MDNFEELVEQRNLLFTKYKEAKANAMAATDPEYKKEQSNRAKILHKMYKDVWEECERIKPEKTRKKRGTRKFSNFNISLLKGRIFADMGGDSHVPSTYNEDENPEVVRYPDIISQLFTDALECCTPLQKEFITRYIRRDTLVEIADDFNVGKSTVCKCVQRGLERIKTYITTKILINECLTSDGFDYIEFVRNSNVIKERQIEILYLMHTPNIKMREIAKYLGLHTSTVCRDYNRAIAALKRVGVEFNREWSTLKVQTSDWINRSEKDVVELLGLSPHFYYHIVCADQKVGDLSLDQYVILKLLREASIDDLRSISEEYGCDPEWARVIYKRYKGIELPDYTVEDYHPKVYRKIDITSSPILTLSRGKLINEINAETIALMQNREVINSAGP